jgi:hypothetical protein
MAERGIICTGESVAAILAGRKTQTRRVVTRSNAILDGHKRPTAEHWGQLDLGSAWVDEGPSPAGNAGPYLKANCARPDCDGAVHRLYPQWSVEQKLWVRESFSYREYASDRIESLEPAVWFWADGNPNAHNWTKPKPSIHMPKRASRVLLEIVDVRVERLQGISPRDAFAEGLRCSCTKPEACPASAELVPKFHTLWDSINAKRGFEWAVDPWIWVVTFKLLEPELAAEAA